MKQIREVEAVLFDVDGTLLDAREFIFQAYEHTLASHRYQPPERELIASLVGRPFEDCYRILAPGGDIAALIRDHRDFQVQHLHLAQPFPGARETLRRLKEARVKLAAVTTRSKLTSSRTLQLAGLTDYLDLLISGEDVEKVKPHPEPLLRALDHFKVSPQHACMVGDTAADILAGRNAGVKTVGVTYGFAGEGIRANQPDYVIDYLADVAAILL